MGLPASRHTVGALCRPRAAAPNGYPRACMLARSCCTPTRWSCSRTSPSWPTTAGAARDGGRGVRGAGGGGWPGCSVVQWEQ